MAKAITFRENGPDEKKKATKALSGVKPDASFVA
jgi:hypothetical protein